MKISAIDATQNFNRGNVAEKKKDSILNKFQTGIKNSADMNDTIVVPRTIFKGYLAFTASTALGALASFSNKVSKPKMSGFFSAAAALSALWGTYSFVRPYLFANTSLEPKKLDK